MTPSDALANVVQLVLRQRFQKDEFDSTDIENTVRECRALFHTTEADRLEATLVLLRRYSTIAGDYSVDAEAAHERRQLGSYGR